MINYYSFINEAKEDDIKVGNYIFFTKNLEDYSDSKENFAKILSIHGDRLRLSFEYPIWDKVGNRSKKEITVNTGDFVKYYILTPTEIEKIKNHKLRIYDCSVEFKRISKKIKFERTVNFLDISFFDIDQNADDVVSYLTVSKISSINLSSAYTSKQRQTTKVGRLFKKLNPQLSDKEIEKYVHEYKAIWNIVVKDAASRLKIVTGEDIRLWYNGSKYSKDYGNFGTLSQSCMRYKRSQSRFDIYCENPDKIAMIIYLDENSKLLARALIWRLDKPEGRIYMDRIYSVNQASANIIKNYGKENGYICYDIHETMPTPLMEVQLNKNYGEAENNPYMDTFKFFYFDKKILTNKSVKSYGTFDIYSDND